jgi:beta-lactamase superfamily II metal-dependent hydrolase
MPGQLGIHVIGPRLGESIVLELPDGGVGVIDSYAGHRGDHPLIGFLKGKRRFPLLTELQFFAITHPHADHCFRCAEVSDALPPKEVWIFRPWPLGQLRDFYVALQKLGSADSVEQACDLPAGSVVHSLLKFEKQFSDRRKAGKVGYKALAWGRMLSLCGGDVVIHFLTPGDERHLSYLQDLKDSLQKISKTGKRMAEAKDLTEPKHNLASGGILIQYGKSRALLMADAEKELWTEWYDSNPEAAKRQPVQFIKASHHGSENGYHSTLYSEIADPKSTIAVVTPFNQGSVHLPSADGVRLLKQHVKNVYCTNRDLAAVSTSLTWKHVVPQPRPRLPNDWLQKIGTKPSLAKLLTTAVSKTPIQPGPAPSLPAEWVSAANNKPELWHLIKPGHRLPIPGLAPAEDYTVSAYLDDSGKVVQVTAGNGAGVLDL